jgi:hypothetical protein
MNTSVSLFNIPKMADDNERVRLEMEEIAARLMRECREKIDEAEKGVSVFGQKVDCILAAKDVDRADRPTLKVEYGPPFEDVYVEKNENGMSIGTVPVEEHESCWANRLAKNPKMFTYWPEDVKCSELKNYPPNEWMTGRDTRLTTRDGKRIQRTEFIQCDVTVRANSTFKKWFKGLAD